MESTGSDTGQHLCAPPAGPDDGRVSSQSVPLRPERNSIVPPFWKRDEQTEDLSSNQSLTNGAGPVHDVAHPAPIHLEDHTDETSDQCKALWARCVTIDDYVIVGGTAPGAGSYVVWNCTVETLDGGPMKIRKRYSEFDELRRKLVETFPHAKGAIPPLPPKSVISKFRPRFLERRHAGLSYFLNCILLNPEFAGSPVVKEFLFA
ncbi:Phox-like protein [Westerdykella ornata]|uniref:Endosomal/vacuolar adapter protein YPT35 n=1 Tax=Westerdykella ornata TaxID=318751 RepID=A0A6A6JXF9_WESOR|nr:Phox-like protein [Westerdykella ornata]KAF2281310.1 Phox-like protein [Westerdykella ornata]